MDFVTFYVWFEVVWGSSKLECEYQPAKMADEPSQVHVMHEWERERKTSERNSCSYDWAGHVCCVRYVFFMLPPNNPNHFQTRVPGILFIAFAYQIVCVCVCRCSEHKCECVQPA